MKWPFITVTEMTQNKISPHLIKYIQGNTGHFLEYSKIQHNQWYKQEKHLLNVSVMIAEYFKILQILLSYSITS